jgi:hypothetical protein
MSTTNYIKIRNGLLENGFTLRAWAMKHGLPYTTVHGAARGDRDGVKARRIRRQLERYIRPEQRTEVAA